MEIGVNWGVVEKKDLREILCLEIQRFGKTFSLSCVRGVEGLKLN